MKRTCFHILILFLSCTYLHAQEYLLNAIPAQEQLPVASINTILQDREGYMWYGTREGGLCRSDGYQIEVFRSPGSNRINALAEDYAGHILFGTRDGLYAIDKEDYSVFCVDSLFRDHDIDPMLIASDSSLWVCAKNTIYHYDKHLKRIREYQSSWQDRPAPVCRMTELADNSIWISQWGGGIVRYNPATDQFEEQPWNDMQPMDIIADKDNRCFWVGTWGDGIVRYEPSSGQITKQLCTSPDQHSSQIVDLQLDLSGKRLFASTTDGLKAYDILDNQLVHVDLEDILPQGIGITDCMTFDRDANLWVGGFPPHTFVLSKRNDNIDKQPFVSFAQLKSEHPVVWNAAREGEYLWFDQDRDMLCLANLKTGKVTFGKDANIPHFEEIRETKFRRCKTQNGIWAYVAKTLLHVWHEEMTIHATQVAETNNYIRCVYDDGAGHVYIGHTDGIERYDIQRAVLERIPNQDTSAIVSLIRYATQEHIRSFDVDYLGHWWIVTDMEIREYAPIHNNYRIWTVSDPDIQMDYFCNVSAVGELMRIDGSNGVLWMKPSENLQEAAINIKPMVTALIINDTKRLIGLDEHVVSVQPSASHIEIHFSTLKHLHTQRISYAYRVAQIDDQWHYLPQGTNKATFVRLPKGTYTIELMATDEYGSWGEPVVALTLHRLPAWFETWWAYMLYIIMTVFVIVLFIEVMVLRRRFRDFQRGEEVEVERVTGNKQDQLFLQKAVEAIEKNLDNDEYNMNAFASDMCMSRATLYRKIVTLTAQKPTEFIRTIRLKHAAQLIREGNHTLTEIGYMCGFNSTSYFYRCFKAQYGVQPGNY